MISNTSAKKTLIRFDYSFCGSPSWRQFIIFGSITSIALSCIFSTFECKEAAIVALALNASLSLALVDVVVTKTTFKEHFLPYLIGVVAGSCFLASNAFHYPLPVGVSLGALTFGTMGVCLHNTLKMWGWKSLAEGSDRAVFALFLYTLFSLIHSYYNLDLTTTRILQISAITLVIATLADSYLSEKKRLNTH